jgi:peroxiredoxin
VAAQAPPQEGSVFLPVGTMAPDFQVQGATRYGLIAQPIRLSQFRGKTAVLAFYFRVRGGG